MKGTVCSEKRAPKDALAASGAATPIITEEMWMRVLEAISCIRTGIGQLPHVKKIAYYPKGQLITLWTFVDNHDKEVLRSIYKAEQSIMDTFSDLRFDFTVIFDPRVDAPSNFLTEFIK